MGREQYHPSSVEPVAKNRLFSQYHYQNQPTMCFFVTVAFRIGTDCNSIRRIIHIGVPKTMEEYCKELGGQQGPIVITIPTIFQRQGRTCQMS